MRNKFKKALALLASAAMCGSMALSYPDGAFSLDAFASTENTETALDGNWTDYASEASFKSNSSATYEIGTAEDFAAFAKALNENASGSYWYGTVRLTADIDLSGHYWLPIGDNNSCFEGTFDGQGYTISNMTIDTKGLYNAGLFGENRGTIKNVNIDSSCSVTGTKVYGYTCTIGAICGENFFGTIENCSNAASVDGTENVGGISGYNPNGSTITSCYNTGDITGTENVGGISGYNPNGSTITSCYNTGDVTGTEDVGGISGYNPSSEIINCYNTGDVNGTEDVGGICGYNPNGLIVNCYNTGEVICNSSYTDEISWNGDLGNNYYLADSDDGNGGKTVAQFASGEVAYLLSQGCMLTYYDDYYYPVTEFFSGEGWGQNLKTDDSDTEYDAYPVISDDVVYAGYETSYCGNTEADRIYSNTQFAISSIPEHESWENGICTACSTICTHESYKNGECDVCDVVCTHESYTDYICDECSTPCSHESWENGICTSCSTICTHEGYTNGECDVCDVVCSHESYTDYICDECGLPCGHNYYDEDEGYVINDYYAADHVITCHICGFEKAEEHTYEDGYCTVCGFDELGKGSDFIYKEDLEFTDDESKGSLDDDGYEWNHETKTLTLGNIYVNGSIILPYYAADGNTSQANTVVISGSSTAVITGNICGSPYDQSLTIMSSDSSNTGTIKTGISNANVGHEDTLTIKDVTLITDSLMWMTDGGLSVEGAELKVSDYCFIEAITIDESSTLELSTTIGGYGNVENGLSDIAHHLPEGYTLVTEGETTYVADSSGEQVDETVIFDGSVVTPCADNNNDGICDSCGEYIDGISAKLAGYTLSLNGNIGVNFYMELDKSVANDENAYMLFTLPNGETKQIAVSEATQNTELAYGKTYYVFSCEVSSYEMTQEIKAQIFDGNGKSGTEYTYTVRDYAEYIINHADSYTADDVAFVKSMLNYGAASQNFFENNTDDLANKNLSTEEQVITEFEADDLDDYISYAKSNKLGTFEGYSLVLDSETTLKAYFKPATNVDVNGLVFTINGVEAKVAESGDYYVLIAENIKAWDLDTTYTFKAETVELSETVESELIFTASVMSYAYSVLNAGDTYSAELRQLVCALREYQLKSEVYVQNN